MYYACSSARARLGVRERAPDSGTLGARRLFIDTSAQGGAPDGATVDAEGCYWLTLPGAWKIARYDPQGPACMRTIELPVQLPTCAAFGGPGLDVLYVTTSRFNRTEAELAGQPLAGGLFRARGRRQGAARGPLPGLSGLSPASRPAAPPCAGPRVPSVPAAIIKTPVATSPTSVREAVQDQAARGRADDQRADQAAVDRAATAGQRDAAHDHGTDHSPELEAGAGGRLRDPQIAEQQRADQAAERAGQREGRELDPVRC